MSSTPETLSYDDAINVLQSMFPDCDRSTLESVMASNNYHLERSVESVMALQGEASSPQGISSRPLVRGAITPPSPTPSPSATNSSNSGCCYQEYVESLYSMRRISAIMILLSLAEFGVGGAAFGWMTNFHCGAWWAAILPFCAAICGLLSYNKRIVFAGAVLAAAGAVTCAVGTIMDGITGSFVNSQTNCINTHTLQTWGQDNFLADICSTSRSTECICIDNFGQCSGFDLTTGSDCGSIMTTYRSLLYASTSLLATLALCTGRYCKIAYESYNSQPIRTTTRSRRASASATAARRSSNATVYNALPTQHNPSFLEMPNRTIYNGIPTNGPTVYNSPDSVPAFAVMRESGGMLGDSIAVAHALEPEDDEDMRVAVVAVASRV